jgi:long-subunit fatty acid transport protein
LFTTDTIEIQAPPVGPIDSMAVFDTLQSLGGMNEIRFAAAYDKGRGTSLGAAFHLLTGSARVDARRTFDDTLFAPIRQTAELSFSGVAFSVGIVHNLSPTIRIAAVARSDGNAKVKQDSSNAVAGHIDLPYTFAAGIQVAMSKKLTVATQGIYRTWSGANSDLLVLGGIGAVNTIDVSLGGEYAVNLRKPAQFPVRLGVHYAQLPFPLNAAGRPHEFSISGGTGARFASDRAGIDLSLEQVWRSQDTDYRERALILTVGVTVTP